MRDNACYLSSYDFAYQASGNKIDYLRGETVLYDTQKARSKVDRKEQIICGNDDRLRSKDEDNFALESPFFPFFAAHRIGKSANFLIRRDAIRL